MLFVLAGPSYVGKKTAISHFVKLYSFSSIIPYTTKNRIKSETDGIQYHYTTSSYIDTHPSEFFYDKPFQTDERNDNAIYAYKKKDINDAVESYGNFIIHASVGNAKQIYDSYRSFNILGESLFLIFLSYQTQLSEDFFKTKYPYEINEENDPMFIRRLKHAKKEQDFYNNNSSIFNKIVINDNAYDLCDSLEEYILPKLKVMPTSPDKIPGPLSDEDIIYMAFHRRNDILRVQKGPTELNEDDLKTILSGCTLNISLSSDIRIIKNKIIDNYINMALDEDNTKDKLNRMYPHISISTGYVLEPNEVILCTSNEKITIPKDVYALVSSCFSYSQLGLSIDLGTSVIQSGHNGHIHFQIKNNTNNYICIYPNISVAQLLLFRTVHPSSKSYHDIPNSHVYDDDSVPPVSKFREKNEALNDIHTPKSTLIKEIFNEVKNSIIVSTAGVIVSIILIILGIKYIPEPIIKNIKQTIASICGIGFTIEQFFLIALLSELLHLIILQFGRLINRVSKRLIKRIHNTSRQSNP